MVNNNHPAYAGSISAAPDRFSTIDNYRQRPWHGGSIFGEGGRRPLNFGDRCLWIARLDACLRLGQIAGKEYLALHAMAYKVGQDGRLDPSYKTIGGWARCSARTAQRACAKAKALGLLEWDRRLKRERGGWRAEQTSNAYRLRIPEAWKMPEKRQRKRPACDGQVGRETKTSNSPFIIPAPEERVAALAALAARREALQRRQQEEWLMKQAVNRRVPRTEGRGLT